MEELVLIVSLFAAAIAAFEAAKMELRNFVSFDKPRNAFHRSKDDESILDQVLALLRLGLLDILGDLD